MGFNEGSSAELRAPFPWFGGKRRVADEVWRRFGNVGNYVEPFAGSLAVLLCRPRPFGGVETVNDLNGFVANFWRALASDPERVAHHANWPVNENDLHARHVWLIGRKAALTAQLEDPEWFDAKIAGWWVWGQSCWIGSGWCSQIILQRPHLGNAGMGVHRKRPHLGDAGMGSTGELLEIAARIRSVRVLCGDWSRAVQSGSLREGSAVGVFLDPPYGERTTRDTTLYGDEESSTVADDVLRWCSENGPDPRLRIALCGYEGEHEALGLLGWSLHRWKAPGGMAATEQAKANATKEVVWFSPRCLSERQPSLFGALA